MEAGRRVIIMGEDGEANVYGAMGGGKSRAGKGDFLQMFGPERIRNTPISEEVMVGAAAGAAMNGAEAQRRPVLHYPSADSLPMAGFALPCTSMNLAGLPEHFGSISC
jgi:pyruvate/2-oxoglutarate/acetoin dehydrogenase E1 component